MQRSRFSRPTYDDEEPEVEAALASEQRPTTSDEPATVIVHNSHLSLSIQQQRSRKSTQVPQFLAEAGWASNGQQIGITEPRRVAAITLATRVAAELQCNLGEKVGFVLRFNEVMTERTEIKFMTDGILLRELHADPLLTKYSILIIDEAHERSITTDLLLGLLKRVLSVRLDLRVIIMSATVDAELFKEFFEFNETPDASKDTSVIVSVEGRMFPVSIFYTKVFVFSFIHSSQLSLLGPVPDYVKATVEACINIHKTEKHGDILAFLTGQDEVEQVCSELRDASRQLKGIRSNAGVAAVRGTAASTTIVDCGFMKVRVNNMESGIETLMTLKISKSSAKQRAGRAGRVLAGKCYRLYPEAEYEKLMPTAIPRDPATEYECSEEIAVILAMLQIQNVFNPLDNRHAAEVTKRKFAVEGGRPLDVAQRLHEVRGVAQYDHTGFYVTLRDQTPFKLYKGSTLMYCKEFPKLILFTDTLQNSIRDCSVIEMGWLEEIAGHYYDFGLHGREEGSPDVQPRDRPASPTFTNVSSFSLAEMSEKQPAGGEQPNSAVYSQLLAVATAAKADEKMDPNVAPMKEEDRKNLKAAMSRLQRSVDESPEELQQAVEGLIDLVCDLDLAGDFVKLGGLKSKFSDSINQRVIPIVSEIAQNNPAVQREITKTKLLEHLLSLLDASSTTTSATIMKTFHTAIEQGDDRLVLRCVVALVNMKIGADPEVLRRLNVNVAAHFEAMRSALQAAGAERHAEALEYLQSDPS
ncbi:hypothetical protein M3Y99_00179200 [Aphelenchoides fujianensis]|nr:hypothetical protein M3Y99_00179200 [Aphelenchoides fujianensis]